MLSQLTVTFGFFALVLVSVYWVNRAIVLFDRLIGSGQSAMMFLQFTAMTLPNVILLMLPVAAFVATVYVSNRMISESEMVVMQSAGQSAWALLRPALYFGLGVAAIMALLAHVLVPLSRTEIRNLENTVSQDVTARFLTEGEYLHPSKGLTLYVRDITELGELKDVMLSDQKDPKTRTLHLAKRALIVSTDDGPRLVMFDGISETLNKEDRTLSTVRFTDSSHDLTEAIQGDIDETPDIRELSTRRLLAASPEDQEHTNKDRAVFLAEGHARLAQPLLGLSLTFVGAATLMLGGFSRFGVARQVLAAVIVVIVVQAINNAAFNAAGDDESLWWLMYVPSGFAISVACGVAWWSTRPAFRRRRSLP